MVGLLENFGFRRSDNISDKGGLSNDDNSNDRQNGNDRTPSNKGSSFDDDSNDDDDTGDKEDFLGDFVDPDNDSIDFNPDVEDEDEDDGNPPDPNAPDADKALIEKMTNSIKSIQIRPDDIPDNMDWNDRKQVSGLLTKFIQSGVQNAVGVMALPMQAALDAQDKNFSKSLKQHGQLSVTRQRMEDAFEPIGESLRGDKISLLYAKEQFEKVYKKTKDPRKAQQATARLMKSLGKVVNLGLKNQGNNNAYFTDDSSDDYSRGPARREGVAALDHFAPIPRNRNAS